MKTKTITLESGTYVIKEPTVGVLFPILDLMEKDPKAFQMGLVKGSIFLADGATALGDGIMNLGLSEYMTLMNEVVEVAGLNAPQVKI